VRVLEGLPPPAQQRTKDALLTARLTHMRPFCDNVLREYEVRPANAIPTEKWLFRENLSVVRNGAGAIKVRMGTGRK